MNCPYCQFPDSKVVDSRDVSDGVRRRRECLKCGSRFTTYELRREEFNKDKWLTGIRKACEKRPLPTGTIDKMAEDIEAEIYAAGKAEVSSAVVGDLVMERLKKVDYIAYIRFASVYRQFTDITAFKQEIDSLVNGEEKTRDVTSQLPLIPAGEFEEAGGRRRRSRR
jgi:transcriptional repressor NrdR